MMSNARRTKYIGVLTLFAAGLAGAMSLALSAKEKVAYVDPNDPTFRLYQTLDTARSGKLTDFYVIADVYKDPANPNEELQHILRAEYDKARGFGKLAIFVRSVGKIQPDQLKTYTAKEFYEFGLSDQEKYMKSDAGAFGKTGDVYLRTDTDRPLASAPITDEVKRSYELIVTQHLLPAIEKK
jgi:hypothetical protein